MDLLIAIAQ